MRPNVALLDVIISRIFEILLVKIICSCYCRLSGPRQGERLNDGGYSGVVGIRVLSESAWNAVGLALSIGRRKDREKGERVLVALSFYVYHLCTASAVPPASFCVCCPAVQLIFPATYVYSVERI